MVGDPDLQGIHAVLIEAVFIPRTVHIPLSACIPATVPSLPLYLDLSGVLPVGSSDRSLESGSKGPWQFIPLPMVVPPHSSSQPDSPTGPPVSFR